MSSVLQNGVLHPVMHRRAIEDGTLGSSAPEDGAIEDSTIGYSTIGYSTTEDGMTHAGSSRGTMWH